MMIEPTMMGIGMLLMLVYGVLIVLALAVSLAWVYHDANDRGMPGWLVATIIFCVGWPFSLVLWYVVRPKKLLRSRKRSPDYSQYDW